MGMDRLAFAFGFSYARFNLYGESKKMKLKKAAYCAAVLLASSLSVNATDFKIDSFHISRDANANWYFDDFNDGIVPPSSEWVYPDGSVPSYIVRPNPLPGPEQGGKLTINPEQGDLAFSAVTGIPISIQRARVNTNASSDPADINRGLKEHRTFTVTGTFDLIEPTINGEMYGIRLVDFGQPGANDNVQLRVRRTLAEDWIVSFVEADFAQGEFMTLDFIPLSSYANIADYEQIQLMLTKANSASKLITASFQLIDLDGFHAPIAESLSGTAQIFDGETWTRPSFLSVVPSVLEPRDLGGDEKGDVLLRHSSTGQFYLWEMDGPSYVSSPLGPLNPVWQVQGIADFGGDGIGDVLLRNTDNGKFYLWEMDGASYTATQVGPLNLDWQVVGVGDFGGDRKADVLLRNQINGKFYLWEMDGASYTPTQVGPLNLDWKVVGIGDFGGDYRADVLLRNQVNGKFYLWEMDGASYMPTQVGPLSLDWEVAGIGDFGGDRKADVLLRNKNNGKLFMWEMDGATYTPSQVGPLSLDWEVKQISDFGGDGRADVLLRNKSNGKFFMWEMDGPTYTSSLVGPLNLVWEVQ
jgi:hypothetical protein